MKSTKLLAVVSLAIGLGFVCAAQASAQCALKMGKNRSLAAARPMIGSANNMQATKPDKDVDPTIVGFWDIKFLQGGVVVDEGFDQFHSDGLEILNDTAPPPTGNVCLGVYEKTEAHSIHLKHPSWIFDTDNATLIGKATILEDITVDKHGHTFTGTFTVKLTDLFDNPIAPDITGELAGNRSTPN